MPEPKPSTWPGGEGAAKYPPAILLYGTSSIAFTKLKAALHLHELSYSQPMPNAVLVTADPDLLTQVLSQWREGLSKGDLTEVRGALMNTPAPSGDDLARALLRLADVDQLLAQLHGRWLVKVLATESFFVKFQPLVSVAERRTVAYECLLRGRNEGAEIGAVSLLSTARVLGLVAQVDEAAWRSAVAQGKGLAELGHLLFINFTPSSIFQPRFALRETLAICERHGVKISQLVFEVTEGEKVRDMAHLREIIREYRSEGAKVAVDDLGSGYSSILHLAELQPDYVKLDQELVRGAHQDYVRSVLLKGIADAAHELGISVVAEGVETEEDLKFCIAIDADLVQGYFLARPAETPPTVSPEALRVLDEWVRDVPAGN